MRNISKVALLSLLAAAFATGAKANIPFFNAICPGQVEIHADEGGPIYLDGKEGQLKRFNDNYYEARSGNMTISLTIRPDGSPDVSYTRKGGGNGMCQVKAAPGMEIDRRKQDFSEPKRHNQSGGMAMGNLPAFCRGEASAQFGVRPTEITTNMAFKSGKRIVVQGYFPNGGRETFFNCWFDMSGNFMSVN